MWWLRLAWWQRRWVWRRVLALLPGLVVGLAGLVAVESVRRGVDAQLASQARALLGGDAALRARRPTPAWDAALADARRRGLRAGRRVEAYVLARAAAAPRARLVELRGWDPGLPLVDRVETAPRDAWTRLATGDVAVADRSVGVALGLRLGDTLVVGARRFALVGWVERAPGEAPWRGTLAPRVFVRTDAALSTGLFRLGSRADYSVVAVGPGAAEWARAWAARAPELRPRTAAERAEDWDATWDRVGSYLSLAAVLAVLLGALGALAGAAAVAAEQRDSAAWLRCFGASPGAVASAYAAVALATAAVAAVLGVGLGFVAAYGLAAVLQPWLPVAVRPALGPVVLVGAGVGLSVAAVAVGAPLIALGSVSPLAAVRREAAPRWSGPSAVAVATATAVVALVGARQAGGVGAGVVLASVGLLAIFGALPRGLARLDPSRGLPAGPLRYGVRAALRPERGGAWVTATLGTGTALLVLLLGLQATLVDRLRLSPTQANVVFWDVQSDQRAALVAWAKQYGAALGPQAPIVAMRIARAHARRPAEGWALRREYRSTYRAALAPSERLLAGRWWTATPSPGPVPVSLEEEIARELGVALGDTIVWDVQGVPLVSVVASLRRVDWARPEPNFFAVFPPWALADAPQTWVLLVRAPDPAQRARLVAAVAGRFPNVSALDLEDALRAARDVTERLARGAQLWAALGVLAGLGVLAAAVAARGPMRRAEGGLLKVLGAERRFVARATAAELGTLAALGAGGGAIAGLLGTAVVAETLWHWPASVPRAAVAAVVTILIGTAVALGLAVGRAVFRRSTLALLRDA